MSTPVKAQQSRTIELRGVRTHNLKGFDLDLPLRSLISVTGVSGAGKSSLAFDTLFAEGQRRYVETFSPYTRQFLAKLDKPDADKIGSIPPAIALGQPHGRHSGRSTVGIDRRNPRRACAALRPGRPGHLPQLRPASRARLAGDRVTGHRGLARRHTLRNRFSSGRAGPNRQGRTRAIADGGRLHPPPRQRAAGVARSAGARTCPRIGTVEVIVDRLVRGKDPVERRTDSIETAFAKGLGRCRVIAGEKSRTYFRGWRCSQCGTDHIEPQPNLFRSNSPLGLCPVCEGFGQTMELDLSRIVPDPSRTIRSGALAPWSTPAYHGFLQGLLDLASSARHSCGRPF